MTAAPFRVGVVGLGFGAAVHVPALQGVPGVEVVALAGTDCGRAQAAADRLGVPIGCGSLEELLNLKLDGVTLALPPDRNEAAVAAVLDRRIPLLSEKPLVNSGAAAAAALARGALGITTAVDFEFMELVTFRALKEQVDAGRFGDVRQVQIVWLVESRSQREQRWSWRTDADRGGGVMAVLGSHLLFLAEWLFGPVERVSATLDRRVTAAWGPKGGRPADDFARLILWHRGGLSVGATLGNACSGGPGHRWDVVFEEATVTISNPGPDYMGGFSLGLRERDGSTTVLAQEPAGEVDGRIAPFRALSARFVDAARRGEACSPDLSDGARIQELMDAAYASDATGRPVTVEAL